MKILKSTLIVLFVFASINTYSEIGQNTSIAEDVKKTTSQSNKHEKNETNKIYADEINCGVPKPKIGDEPEAIDADLEEINIDCLITSINTNIYSMEESEKNIEESEKNIEESEKNIEESEKNIEEQEKNIEELKRLKKGLREAKEKITF